FFDLNIFAPESGTLSWGPAVTPYLLVFVPVRWLTGSPLAGLNTSLVVVTVLTLVVTFGFLRRLGFGDLAAATGAVLYAATWERLTHVVHLESYATFWIPLVGWLFLRACERRRPRDGLLLALGLGGAFLGGPYYFVGVALAIAVLVAVLAVRRDLDAAAVRTVAVAAVVTAVIVGPFVWFTLVADLQRPLDHVQAASWLDPFHPGPFATMMRAFGPAAVAGGASGAFEHDVHPGVGLAVLGAVGAVEVLRRRRGGKRALPTDDPLAIALLVILALVGIVLFIGPVLRVGQATFTLPSRLLWELPGIRNLRANPRLVALPYLGLTVLAAVGIQALTARLTTRNARLAVGATAVTVTLVLSISSVPASERFDVDAPATQVNRVLAQRPTGVVLELPWPNCPGRCLHTEPARMVWSRYDRMPRLGGYSGYVPDYWLRIQELSVEWANPDVLRELRERWEVRYLILRTSAPEGGVRLTPEAAATLATTLARDGQIERAEHIGPSWLVTLRPAAP
ncbi:MAG TPA: hypothetical protein VGA36_04415, partial [Nitriliruptorales bacterium]